MSWEDDGVFLGNTEIGESLRGMQDDEDYLGAVQKLAALKKGALGQLANRFNRHAPVQKQLRSPYKDSTQIAVECSGSFTPANWQGTAKPVVYGQSRVYKSFKPNKAIVTEQLVFTFETASLGVAQVAANVDQAADVILVQAFAGADNCFPNAPNQQNGIRGPALSPSTLGNGISWPTLNAGIDMSVGFALSRTALFQAQPPAGYTFADLIQIDVELSINLMGPSLR